MFHVVHLTHVFFSLYEKGLLNFVTERKKVVYMINNTRLAFQTQCSTIKIYRPHTLELKSISKFQLLFHWRNFEKYMIFYTLPWSRWNRTHTVMKYVRCTVRVSRIRSEMSWSSTHIKIWTLKQLHHCTQRLHHKGISILCF